MAELKPNQAVPDRADAVIIGGGIVGASAAYYLARRGVERVVLLERGLMGQGATGKCLGGIRTQFSTEINIRLSMMSRGLFKDLEEESGLDFGFQPTGYLLLAEDEARRELLKSNAELMKSLGLEVEFFEPDGLNRNWPFLKTDDLAGGLYSASDGVLSPHEVLQGFIKGARRRGALLLEGVAVTGLSRDGDRIAGVETSAGRTIKTEVVVNAAGAWAAQAAALAGLNLEVMPFRRQVFFTVRFEDLPAVFPLTIDLGTGWYMRREGSGLLLAGPGDRESSFSETVDFDGREWAAEMSMRRVPILERARIIRGWAGLYAVSPDSHAILGESPDLKGFFLANGFSGHGFQHSAATGLLLAELIVDGRASSLDVGPLSPRRFSQGRLIHEPLTAFRG